jgi:para-nitrobenzyl esterase
MPLLPLAAHSILGVPEAMAWCTSAALFAAVAGFAAPTASAEPGSEPRTGLSTLVETPLGKVQGFMGEGNTLEWRGIPYAAPPTGQRRWRSPEPPANWTDVLDATEYAADCAQFGPAWVSLAPKDSQAPCHNNIQGCVNWTWSNATSEDCLYVNVYQSADAAPAPRPVVVYFAAGALEWGSGDDLENSGEGIGSKPGWKDVILVTLNYRKGIFGFLASDELKKRDARNTAGLFGMQDQTMALRWVRQNIGAFGGDASRVTLFGESAGATSVSLHMVMPESQGLFHGAIMDSGSFNQWTYRPWCERTSERTSERAAVLSSSRSFSSACPEPVLANQRISEESRSKRGFSPCSAGATRQISTPPSSSSSAAMPGKEDASFCAILY